MRLHAGVKDLHEELKGVHSFCAGGRAHHRITLREPSDQQRPIFLQLLIYDHHELQDRMGMKVADGCDSAVMASLQAMLHSCNPYVQQFKQMKDVVQTQDVNLCFMADASKYVIMHCLLQQ